MERAVDAVDHQRLVFADDIENALHAQQLVAPGGAHGHQPAVEAVPVERFVEVEAERTDVRIVSRPVVVMMVVRVVVRFGVQPAAHPVALAGGIEGARVEQQRGIDCAPDEIEETRAGIEVAQPGAERCGRSGLSQIAFAQQQPVGDCGLLHGFDMLVELARAVHGVNRRHDAVEPVVVADHRRIEQELQDRRRIGEAGRLQQHAIERGDLVLGAAARLKRLSERIEEGVKNNELPGAVVLIARNGKIVMHDAFGFRDREANAPMKTDTIFRIASMTKPIVSVATMMLMEEGKLTLADPVSRFIPAFAETKVSVQKKNADGTVELVQEPQTRPMTVQDLLRHTSGLTYGGAGPNPVKKSYVDMKVTAPEQTNAEMADKFAKLALMYQPGTRWEYSMSTDVLGRVVEVASGMSLDKFLEERILKPLKMGDTGFEASADKKDRGARPHKEGPKNELPNVPDITRNVAWKSGGGGMVSTAADYARFLQMFANGGQLDGARLLSRKSIDLMTADHLGPDVTMGDDMWRFEALEPSKRMGQGFGLGFAVRTDQGRSPLPGTPGDYYWGGAFGTYFWHDPRERMYVILMMQSPTARLRYRYLMRDLVYQALVGN